MAGHQCETPVIVGSVNRCPRPLGADSLRVIPSKLQPKSLGSDGNSSLVLAFSTNTGVSVWRCSMSCSRTMAIWILMLVSWAAATNVVLAQSFEERWSPIPKAHAEPTPAPQPNSQPDPNANAVSKPQVNQTERPKLPRAASKSSSKARAAVRRVFTGKASYYSYHGGRTASGQPFNPNALTAAHRSLPFGTRVRVTDIKTKKTVQVIITDRGPASRKRVLDLSLGAARALDIGSRGVVQVRAEIISS
jgi:peptidoglycan lytic transglycosylase